MRFPKVQNAPWKKRLIEKLIDDGHDISILFAEASFLRHLKFGLRNSGLKISSKKREINSISKVKLYPFFKDKIVVKKVNNVNSFKSQKIIENFKPDCLLLLGSGIIRPNILSIPRLCTLHCHIGKLPEMRGTNTVHWSVLLSKELFLSMRKVDSGIDTGNVIKLKEIPYHHLNTIDEVYESCYDEIVELIFRTIKEGKFNETINFDKVVDPLNYESSETSSNLEESNSDKYRQYFSMHPFLKSTAESLLTNEAINSK